MELKHVLKISREIARDAANLIRSRAGVQVMEWKGAFDPVTQVDRDSEKLITQRLRNAFPNHGILAEEGTSVSPEQGFCWIVDPLDGTTNYAHALPYYGISIALSQNGVPVLGVVIAPELHLEFHAVLGHGARLNDRPIHVSNVDQLARGFLATGEPYNIRDNLDYHVGLFKKFAAGALGIRRFGSASLDLCHVAWGRYDGYWEAGLKAWDAAAGMLIVSEAGGKVTDYRGQPHVLGTSETILASNSILHDALLDTIKLSPPLDKRRFLV